MTASPQRQGVFVSYSHSDTKWLERLRIFLKPALGSEAIWDDTMLKPGESWKDEIERAIARARVAVLLVTPAFLASPFIVDDELPRIIERQTKEGLTIIWIAVEPSPFEYSPLSVYQAANDPRRPLSTLRRAQQDMVLVQITERIIAAVNVNAVGNILKNVDKLEPQLRAFVEGRPTPSAAPVHRTTARQEPGTDTITIGPERITGADLVKLDSRSRQLIRAYESAINDLFDRFTELEPRRSARDPEVRQRARTESEEVRQEICEKWSRILAYLQFLGKHLEDHYDHVRFICQQPLH
jgi:hypothetical protein